MGGTPSKDPKYINASTTLDLLHDEPVYGLLFIMVVVDSKHTIKEKWSENRQKWFSEDRQLILSLLNGVVVSNSSGDSLTFHLCIPFSKNNLKLLPNSLRIDFEFNNYFTGFKGYTNFEGLPNAFMAPSKTTSAISFIDKEFLTFEFFYTIAGTPLFDDLKHFEVPELPLKEQQTLLAKVVKFGTKRGLSLITNLRDKNLYLHQEHIKIDEELLGRNTLELLIKGYQKEKYSEFEEIFLNALEYYEQKSNSKTQEDEEGQVLLDFEDNFYKVKDSTYPAFPNKLFESITLLEVSFFWKIMKVFVKKARLEIYSSEKIFKKVIETWNYSQSDFNDYLKYCSSWQTYLTRTFDTSWFYDTIVQPILQGRTQYFEILKFLMQECDEVWPHLLTLKLDLSKIKDTQIGYFLHNKIFTPGFKILPLKLREQYGCSSEIVKVLNFENPFFSTKMGENKNIVAITATEKKFFMTHVFARLPKFDCSAHTTDVLFLVSNEHPSQESLEKYYDLTFEQYNNEQLPKDDDLKPIAFLHFENLVFGTQSQEKELGKIVEGHYLTFIFLKACRNDQNMDIGCVGGLGFMGQEAYEKCKGEELLGGFLRIETP